MIHSFFLNRTSKLIETCPVLGIDKHSRIIIFSDCHRGHGDRSDDFFHNQYVFINALKHYFENDFTYIELGDGDELWETPILN